ncbi:hypothetical protein H0H92_002716 [Tricholoma furcatifolium]|nr:hypothetical protein H0H92_002716 [Tricholoma furcatifolium]
MASRYWLLKAEPDSRVVKGKDVKFSVDDFESVKTSPWEGVRNYEARNLMKEMKVGEKKTNKDDPKWFMVDLTFSSRAKHFVPLALLRFLCESSTLPPEVNYIQEDGLKALKDMDLVGRGRLSVQRVQEGAWAVIVALAEKGGWEEMDLRVKKGKQAAKPTTPKEPKARAVKKPSPRKVKEYEDSEEDEAEEDDDSDDAYSDGAPKARRGSKRKAKVDDDEAYSVRSSRRAKR